MLVTESDFLGWHAWTKSLLAQHISKNEIKWVIKSTDIIYKNNFTRDLPETEFLLNIPRKIVSLIIAVFYSGNDERFSLLYELLEKIRDKEPLDEKKDPLLLRLIDISHRAKKEALQIRQKLPHTRFTHHSVIRINSPVALLDSQAYALFAQRPEAWLIRTPGRIICSYQKQLFFSPDAPESILNNDEALFEFAQTHGIRSDQNDLWRSLIPFRIRPHAEFIEKAPNLTVLQAYAADCQLCELCTPASRTVFGEGNQEARLMFVGEQPGDQEDLQGRPFVGPAGQLFDNALNECGFDREKAWVTNAVKHFRFTPRGSRRIHQKPEAKHIHACAPWLKRERDIIRPKVTIMLGVTGGSAVLGRPITVSRERSKILTLLDGSIGLVTVHPSYLLRQPDEESRSREYAHFIADLKLAFSALP
ncbi:UdgX family uracil-DNA binding protein [Aristophania vespae]|uniref:Type-4 uracil-DNA glycosylase n=2 Tax=Aristophania vespae TaxID=2697033 RepID=A0A6P1NDK9_9PROT|nr:UdgX family uracil-DNA binding protein [Aristophania vespae]